ncbi:MAG: hypothetical protein V2B20_16860 [Pseudomonadota bacterium]
MKMIYTSAVFLLCCLAGVAQADDSKLPLEIRISLEKLLLIEEYQTALTQCREIPKKHARDTCISRRKTSLAKTLDDLQQNPRAYFITKDQQQPAGKKP